MTGTNDDMPRVVIAEDEAIIRMDLCEMLEEEGFDVVGEAADGRQAVDLAREHRPDLVILDIKMPGMNGIRAAEMITRERIAPVLILTAFSQRDLAAPGGTGRSDGLSREAVPEERSPSGHRGGARALQRSRSASKARWPSWPSVSRPASSSSARRGSCRSRAWARPRPTAHAARGDGPRA